MVMVPTEKAEASAVARHIARVAARLFATQGFDATSVRMIVEEAGVTKPTLYYHFGSKEGLAQALLTVPMAALVETLRSIARLECDPVERLERIFEAHLDFCREEPDRARFFFALVFGPHGPGPLAQELLSFCDGLDSPLVEGVRALAEAGVIAPERIDDCVHACDGFIHMAVLDFLFKGVELNAALARRLVGDMLWGFGVPGSNTGRFQGS